MERIALTKCYPDPEVVTEFGCRKNFLFPDIFDPLSIDKRIVLKLSPLVAAILTPPFSSQSVLIRIKCK